MFMLLLIYVYLLFSLIHIQDVIFVVFSKNMYCMLYLSHPWTVLVLLSCVFLPMCSVTQFLPCLIVLIWFRCVSSNYPSFSSVFKELSAPCFLVWCYMFLLCSTCVLAVILDSLEIVKLILLRLHFPYSDTVEVCQNTGPNKDDRGWGPAVESAAEWSVIGEVCGGIPWIVSSG